MNQEMDFRALLVKVQDCLSDGDRHRLHFLFGNVIPRQLRDDPTISGTLNVLESLFDRGLIDDHDFDFLTQAFRQIQCTDVVKRLEAHARAIRHEKSVETPSTLLADVMHDNEEDKVCTASQYHLEGGLLRNTTRDCFVCLGTHPDKAKLEMDVDSNREIRSQFSASNIFDSIKGKYSIKEQLFEPSCKELIKKWSFCRSLALFNIVGILAIVILLTFLIVRARPRPIDNPSMKNCNSGTEEEELAFITPVILAYYTSWSIYARQYFVNDIPADKITHISYAVAKIDTDGRVTLADPYADTLIQFPEDKVNQSLSGNFNQLIKLKKKYPHLRTLVSVGGDAFEQKFKAVVVSNQSRAKFAASCVKFVEDYDFDGIDLDWRDPMADGWPNHSGGQEDKQKNFVLLLKELRRQLNGARDKKYLLVLTTGVNPIQIDHMNLTDAITYVDWVNVLTYNLHDSLESQTGHNTPLYKNDNETGLDASQSSYRLRRNVNAAIQAYLAGGVPPYKIVMGLALYGRSWQGVESPDLNGFLQPAANEGPNGTWEKGFVDYDDLKKNYIPYYRRFWDDQSKVPFLFNQSTGIWISYDDLESIKWKAGYVKKHRLRGAFFWELSKDRQGELVGAVFNALNNTSEWLTQNLCAPWRHPLSNDKVLG